MNPYRGWEIYEPGIYDIITNLRDNYGNPRCFISENGMGVENEQRFIQEGQVNDSYRIEFVAEHLKWLHKGISEGCNCLGYHMWTFIDNWSWLNAYKNRYGFVQLDLETQTRTIKKVVSGLRQLQKITVLIARNKNDRTRRCSYGNNRQCRPVTQPLF